MIFVVFIFIYVVYPIRLLPLNWFICESSRCTGYISKYWVQLLFTGNLQESLPVTTKYSELDCFFVCACVFVDRVVKKWTNKDCEWTWKAGGIFCQQWTERQERTKNNILQQKSKHSFLFLGRMKLNLYLSSLESIMKRKRASPSLLSQQTPSFLLCSFWENYA